MMNSASARGRRRGKPETRAHILTVARQKFLRDGYRQVTLRSVAVDADVDVALISYYFGSKRGLFAAALELVVSPADVLRVLLTGNLETLGPRALHAMISTWDSPRAGGPLIAALGGAVGDHALGTMVRTAIEAELIDKLADRIGGADAHVRAGLFASQIAGVIYSRYLIRVEPIASMSVDEIVARLGPALTHTLRGPVRRSGRIVS